MAEFDIYLKKVCGWANGEERFSAADLQEARGILALLDETLLHYAAVEGMDDCVRFMAKNGWSCNVRNRVGSTPLKDAATLHELPMMKTLVEGGADVNFVDGNGESVLQNYVFNWDDRGDLPIIDYLVAQGSDTGFDVFDFDKGEYVSFKKWLEERK